MALGSIPENTKRHQSPSPSASSVASSSARTPRIPQLADDSDPRKHDKHYRRYAASIERTLASFDSTRQEWADYISFLGRLSKTVQAHPPSVGGLPCKSEVAHRLSQCLNPSLPSGVHQKAIEVYSTIFSLIGKDALGRDLHIYLPGLSTVLSFASLSLRPAFLLLLETHIVTLNAAALRPAHKALILALLPGLEEENSEDFERILNLISRLKVAINNRFGTDFGEQGFGDEFFWQCLFLASISAPSRRQGALAFLVRYLPRLGPSLLTSQSGATVTESSEFSENTLPAGAESVIAPEPGLLVRCFVAGLEDDQVLVQRGFLDLLLSHLPLNSPVLTQRASVSDVQRLVHAATAVVLRRDMSLNRRLWTWFLGAHNPDLQDDVATSPPAERVSPEARAIQPPKAGFSYFVNYGSVALTNTILVSISYGVQGTASDMAKPFRICLSLMDRAEIGNTLIPGIFEAAMGSLLSFQQKSRTEDFNDVMRSARSFFDGIESVVIWMQVVKLLESSLSAAPPSVTLEGKLDIVQFILTYFTFREEDMMTIHLPLVTALLLSLTDSREAESEADSSEQVVSPIIISKSLDILAMLVAQLSKMKPNETETESTSHSDVDKSDTMFIHNFYARAVGADHLPLSLSSQQVSDLLLTNATSLLLRSFRMPFSGDIEQRSVIWTGIISIVSSYSVLDAQVLVTACKNILSGSSSATFSFDDARPIPFTILRAVTSILVEVHNRVLRKAALSDDFSRLLSDLIEAFWYYLDPVNPAYHVEAVHCLWEIDDLTREDHVVEASIARALMGVDKPSHRQRRRNDAARRFAIFWTHSTQNDNAQAGSRRLNLVGRMYRLDNRGLSKLYRPMVLLLDTLCEPNSDLGFFTRSWLKTLPSVGLVLDRLVLSITSLQTDLESDATSVASVSAAGHRVHDRNTNLDRQPQLVYHLRLLLGILQIPSEHIWTIFSHMSRAATTMPERPSLQSRTVKTCLAILTSLKSGKVDNHEHLHESVEYSALSIISLILKDSPNAALEDGLEETLVELLLQMVISRDEDLQNQVILLDTILFTVRRKMLGSLPAATSFESYPKSPGSLYMPIVTPESAPADKQETSSKPASLPSGLVKCIQAGISSPVSYAILEHWILFLVEVLPFFGESLFQVLLPMVETFCRQVQVSFDQLKLSFDGSLPPTNTTTESALTVLLTGLEHLLATAHNQLDLKESQNAPHKGPEPTHGFFGNVVSGVFNSEVHKGRTSVTNTRLTVLLCFQDVVRLCSSIWSWMTPPAYGDGQGRVISASFAQVSLRLRNKARRILDRMISTEPLECLETLIAIFSTVERDVPDSTSSIISLLNALDGTRPKLTIPAIFDAIHRRSGPTIVDATRSSTLSSPLTEIDLGQFLFDYTESLDADALDEIWGDCMNFMRNVLSNPLLHNNLLPYLLMFLLVLGEKMDHTNFGDQKKMRRELGDLFMRLLAATFTTRPSGMLHEPISLIPGGEKPGSDRTPPPLALARLIKTMDITSLLALIVPRLQAVFPEQERLNAAAFSISTSVISPLVHAKAFPENTRGSVLDLQNKLGRVAGTTKVWKKDVSDAFNHAKFFSVQKELVQTGWLPIIRQWTVSDRTRIEELLGRITAPTTAGIMFGVGASAARLEADKRTQLNLRRVAVMLMAMKSDYVVPYMAMVLEKTNEMLFTTVSSSPSSNTRADVYMLLRAIMLRTSPAHQAAWWPLLNMELQKALTSTVSRGGANDTYNGLAAVEACKLLDLLIIISPEDFQLYEWIFITDTIDAVYRPGQWEPVALVDEIAEDMGPSLPLQSPHPLSQDTAFFDNGRGTAYKSVLLDIKDNVAEMSKEEIVAKILRPFFAQLSIHAYEAAYSMRVPDIKGCEAALLADLFDDTTIIG